MCEPTIYTNLQSWLLYFGTLQNSEAALQRYFLKKRSEKMQQIYRRTPMPKCDFNKVAFQLSKLCSKFTREDPCRNAISKKLQLYWNRTSAWVYSSKFSAYFQNTFFSEHFWPLEGCVLNLYLYKFKNSSSFFSSV